MIYEWAHSHQHNMKGVDYDVDKIKLPDFMLEKVLLNKTLGYYSTGEFMHTCTIL